MEVILGIIAALAIIRLWQKNQEAKRDLEETRTFLLACNRKLDEERTRTAALSAAAEDLILAKKRIGELSRYEPIEDVDKAITEKRNALAAEKAQMVAELEKSRINSGDTIPIFWAKGKISGDTIPIWGGQ